MRPRLSLPTRWRQKPTRIRPQLLAVPNRSKVEAILNSQSASGRLPIVAMELEREESLANGSCIVLVVFVRNPDPQRLPITCRHVMRGAEPDPRAVEAGAEQLGRAIAKRLGLSVENDAAAMLRGSWRSSAAR